MICNTKVVENHESKAYSGASESGQWYARASFVLAAILACVNLKKICVNSTPVTTAVGEGIPETGFTQSIEVSKLLFDTQSKYQHIQIYQAAKPYYGRILVLDDVLQLAEGDASAYNEMMAHMAMFSHPNPKNVLVIGGGDGYVVKEVLKHKSVKRVDHVDLDGEVIKVCREYFPQWGTQGDKRVTTHIADGAAYCRDYAMSGNVTYDVIIQDSSDPWTGAGEFQVPLPSGVLYTSEHVDNLYRILDPVNGVLIFQAEMLQIPSDFDGVVEWRQTALKAGFSQSRYGSILISSYPTGQIGFLLCEKNDKSVQSNARLEERFQGMRTEYFHPQQLTAAFVLPYWAEKAIYGNFHLMEANQNMSTILLNSTDSSGVCKFSDGAPASFQCSN